MQPRQLNDTELLRLMTSQYGGVRAVAQYYLRRAKDAAGRARVALTSQNPYALGAEAQTMITNIEMLVKVLGDDSQTLEDKKNIDTKSS